jgi:hypothetical protein
MGNKTKHINQTNKQTNKQKINQVKVFINQAK